MATKLSGNMNFPRNAVFGIISEINTFVETITEGVRDTFSSDVEDVGTVDNFNLACENSFADISSEYLLESALTNSNLIHPFEECEIITGDVQTNESSTFEEDAEEDYDDLTDASRSGIEYVTFPLLPMEFQIKKFLELPNVFEKIDSYTKEVRRQGKLNHFINGESWKAKLQAYDLNEHVIPIIIYFDGAQINNALGSHYKLGNEMFIYYSFPTIPPEYNSRLENIFVALLHPEHFNKRYGNERLYNVLIEELNKLADNGIVLTINGVEKKVFFVVGVACGDNKELNNVMDMVTFGGNHYCRFCTLHKVYMQKLTEEAPENLRNRENYLEHVEENDVSATGVYRYSPFNDLALFHVVESLAADLMHDLTEGILHLHFALILLHFIREKKAFNLNTLNERMRSLDYGEVEKGNVSCDITIKHLENMHLRMSSSEMHCFATHLPFMIGDLINTADPVWQFYLTTMRAVNLCELPDYTDANLEEMKKEIGTMIEMFTSMFEKDATPKHHIMTHYPRLTKRFGPLRYIHSIRFEGNHRKMKSYAKNTNSRINFSISLAKKLQFNFAARLMAKKGLDDRIEMLKHRYVWLNNEDFNEDIEPSQYADQIRQQKCYLAEKLTVNGIVFSTKLFLPYVEQIIPTIYEVVEIVSISKNDINGIFFVCKKYTDVVWHNDWNCFSVNKEVSEAKLTTIWLKDFLLLHQYPVHLHNVDNKFMFNCKRF
ncbi:hypothetical protein HA402_012659 [Bradysia odoriphaga]|nr:hypothetical protein HA402_012659 [Bradysia odoriphaga]